MSIDPSEARKVAHLARIAVADDALPALAAELNGILQFMEQLNEVDVEGVEPMSHPMPIVNVTRPDVVRPSLTPEQALAMAPASEVGRFAVPRILTED